MKWSEISGEQWDSHNKYIEERWKDLSDYTHEWSKESLKMLFLTNSGGAVAILTFIGTASTVRAEFWPWLMLGFFCFGIILLQIFHGLLYYKVGWMFECFRKDTIRLYADKLEWDEFHDKDDARADKFTWFDIFPIAAGLCFITAVVIGFSNYETLIQKEKANEQIRKSELPESASKTSPRGREEGEPSKNPTTSTAKEEIKKPAQ